MARSTRVAALGMAGHTAAVLIDPIDLPKHWPRVYALDVDRGQLGAAWGAFDRASNVLYLTAEYAAAATNLPVVADAIRQRGSWIPGLIEMEGRKRTKASGETLLMRLVELGLQLVDAPSDPEAGIAALTERIEGGRLKVFRTMQAWASEYRQFERLPDGKLPPDGNLLMGATGLLALHGLTVAITENSALSDAEGFDREGSYGNASEITGY